MTHADLALIGGEGRRPPRHDGHVQNLHRRAGKAGRGDQDLIPPLRTRAERIDVGAPGGGVVVGNIDVLLRRERHLSGCGQKQHHADQEAEGDRRSHEIISFRRSRDCRAAGARAKPVPDRRGFRGVTTIPWSLSRRALP